MTTTLSAVTLGIAPDASTVTPSFEPLCPSFPCPFSYREKKSKKLLKTLASTMKLMFAQEHIKKTIDQKVDLLDASLNTKSPKSLKGDTIDQEFMKGGISMEDVCGSYLRDLFFSLMTVNEQENEVTNFDSITSQSVSEDDDDSQTSSNSSPNFSDRIHPFYELYENFRIILKRFPKAARYIDHDGMTLLHHLCLFYTSNVDRKYRYHAIDEENIGLFQAIQVLIRMTYTCSPKNAGIYAKTERGFITPLHILLTSANNNLIDYELLHKIICDNPDTASQEYMEGKLPLHLLLASIPDYEKDSERYISLLKKMLDVHPLAAFRSVYEELRFLRVNIPEDGVDPNTFQTFTMQVRKVTWSPVEKVEEMKSGKVKHVFEKFLNAMTWNRIKSQAPKNYSAFSL